MMGTVVGRPRRGVIVSVGVVVALLLAAMAGGRPGRGGPPLDPRSDGPLGTSALVSLLRGLGADVDLSAGLPGPTDEVALVLQDTLSPEETTELLRWVDAGGTLVVTDPSSKLVPPAAGQGLALDAGPIRPGRCTIRALGSIGAVDGGAAVRFRPSATEQVCFSDDRSGAFVVVTERGNGHLVSVGGAALLTNDLLGRRDNAVLAATLLAPLGRSTVRFVQAPVPAGGGTKTLGDLVPIGLKRALLQLGVAFVLYALWRGIRLGRPVPEDQLVQVAGSELVSAIGRLLSRTRSPGFAAEALRARLRRSLRARLGLPTDADASTVAELTAARTGLEVDQVLAAIDERPVSTDAELMAVATAVASIYEEVPQ